MPALVDPGALAAVAVVDLALRRSCDVPSVRRTRLRLRLVALSEPLLLQLAKERVERALQDDDGVAARVPMAHQRLCSIELLLEGARDRDLEGIARLGQRLDAWGYRREQARAPACARRSRRARAPAPPRRAAPEACMARPLADDDARRARAPPSCSSRRPPRRAIRSPRRPGASPRSAAQRGGSRHARFARGSTETAAPAARR